MLIKILGCILVITGFVILYSVDPKIAGGVFAIYTAISVAKE